jgi:hypothetical protein
VFSENEFNKQKSGSRILQMFGLENGKENTIFRNVGKNLPNDIPEDLGLYKIE